MGQFRILYAVALILARFAMFALWVLTGFIGLIAVALFVDALLCVCRMQKDGENAAIRKARDKAMKRAFRGGRDRP